MESALIIEDDPSSALFLKALLRALGIESEICASISSASKYLLSGVALPHVIFLDLSLEESDDGLSLLKAIIPSINVPVIMISGTAAFNKISECLRSGASSYLIKPVQRGLLLDTLRDVGVDVIYSK